MRKKCKKCRWYFESPERFENSDYIVCEQCGRLLTSYVRTAEIVKKSKVVPKVLWVCSDNEMIRDLRNAMYDPRRVVSTSNGLDLLRGGNGVSRVVSEVGDLSYEFRLTELNPDDKNIYSIISEERPNILILVLECSGIVDMTDYIKFLNRYSCVMQLVSSIKQTIIVVLSNADMVLYPDIKEPHMYPESKKRAIMDVVDSYRDEFSRNGVRIDNILPVSTYVKWKSKAPNASVTKAEDLEIIIDGRYNIDILRKEIEKSSSIMLEK